MTTSLRTVKARFSHVYAVFLSFIVPVVASADITTAKMTTREHTTRSAVNRISVKTGNQEEIASVFLPFDETATRRNEARAGAITSQMTRATAAASEGVGAYVITITALNNRKITGIDHNGLNGEEINVNPQSLLYTNTKLTALSGQGEDNTYFAMSFPQIGADAFVPIFAGMTTGQLLAAAFEQLIADGMTGTLNGDILTLDPVLIGGEAVDPFSVGANYTYTGAGAGFDLHMEYFFIPTPSALPILAFAPIVLRRRRIS